MNHESRIMNHDLPPIAKPVAIKDFRDLNAWKEGHNLVLDIYHLTQTFPNNEVFGLISQMRRAAVSITSNIAEGFSRATYNDKKHFYVIAHGSLTELQNQIIIGRDVGYITKDTFSRCFDQSILVHKILTGLIKATKERS